MTNCLDEAAQRGPEPKTRTLADENAAHVTVNDHGYQVCYPFSHNEYL
ncbi:hypothetical protein An08g01880 [Aspergillus niger]|uniref:Uncharacterized protein n=2 Tax=Aspergillus niger TaxID=5061 RepID=A2QQB1_ASPNC|nr:hypothetical protein An08g01880 [Aspergillus niger]CAK39868.1 hypothetical protein An08g01880 [Aspergillus niger]